MKEREHTQTQAFLFFAKAWVFRIRRLGANFVTHAPRRLALSSHATGQETESRSPLYTSTNPAEFALQAGKVQNLRVAVACINGRLIPAGEVFSFWAHIPRPTRRRAFVDGRELREGCIIPSVGGGLCQLSNAIYDVALGVGCEIVERHAHSQVLPGSMAEAGRDATVFWNYVDLRFRATVPLQLSVEITRDELIVRLVQVESALTVSPLPVASIQSPPLESPTQQLLHEQPESCETCGIASCFRHIETGALPGKGITAWLVDAWWPEFDRYLGEQRQADDWLFIPLESQRFRFGQYNWNTRRFRSVVQAPWEVLKRSLVSRRLAAQGAERQRALLAMDEGIAKRYARSIPYTATHLVISQNLLPHLWRAGVLGGRTFDVLMTRLPLAALEAQLDAAQQRHPESSTLGDFRADPQLLADESAALAEARHWITPHGAIAALGECRAVKLEWKIPAIAQNLRVIEGNHSVNGIGSLVFPASTLGRKGAYELREVAKNLGLPLTLAGRVIECPRFWDGIEITVAGDDDWFENASVVVAPAWVEHEPRRLLKAVGAGIPVIASEACGLAGLFGVTTIPDGDVEALQLAIQTHFTELNAKPV